MPIFEGATHSHIDHSDFNDVGRDQIITHSTVQDQTIISDSIIRIGHNQDISNSIVYQTNITYHHPRSCPVAESHPHSEATSRGIVLRPTFRSSASDSCLVAARLIVEIVQSLPASDQFRNLKEDLKTLQQTLDLGGLAIEAHQCTPIGRILSCTISEERARCIGVLRNLLNTIRDYQRDVKSMHRFFSLSRALGGGGELGEICVWRDKLSDCQKSLGQCLRALDSTSLRAFGSSVRAQNISPANFNRLLQQGPPFLRHIQVSKVTVVDHLGRNIPVPIIFCSVWQDFYVFISELCKGSAGHEFIERRDFSMLHNNKVIDPLEFPDRVASGMTIEMSIILRRRTSSQSNTKKCPRCGYSTSVPVGDGWVECWHCSGQYQLSRKEEIGPQDSRQLDEDNVKYLRRIQIVKTRPFLSQ
ncbi:hypothetical protein F5887DRAFT_988374 [Amanita rubescens]|nr:hypothetical protein F5887DRAFT_988374 [Amanita rubescens]